MTPRLQVSAYDRRASLLGKPRKREGIVCINHETLHRHGGALVSQYKLRFKMFYGQYWHDVNRFRGMEYNQYDTPAATYLVWQDARGAARGLVRMSPTDRPYMIREWWPHMSKKGSLPNSLSVWEMTRLCVDCSLPQEMRQRVKHELLCAMQEFGLMNDIRHIIVLSIPKVWKSAFIDSGWPVEFLGNEHVINGNLARVALLEVAFPLLQNIRTTTGVEGVILQEWYLPTDVAEFHQNIPVEFPKVTNFGV